MLSQQRAKQASLRLGASIIERFAMAITEPLMAPLVAAAMATYRTDMPTLSSRRDCATTETDAFIAKVSMIAAAEAKIPWLLLGINGMMFFIELIWGWLAQSTGLVADSLDMFADAAVYGTDTVWSTSSLGQAPEWLQVQLIWIGNTAKKYAVGEPRKSCYRSAPLSLQKDYLATTTTCPFMPASKCPGCRHAKSTLPAFPNCQTIFPVFPGVTAT